MSSTVIAKNLQVGADGTATNNFTLYQPASPDGTLRLGNGNTGITSSLLTLTSGGNLGIGTSSPSYKLHLASSSASDVYARFQNSNNSNFFVGVQGSSGDAMIYNVANGPIRFFTNDTERMRLDSSGNLGLGVTPSAWNTSFYTAAQVGAGASVFGSKSNASVAWLNTNSFFNSSNNQIYIANGFATQYRQLDGVHAWFTAPSGTAGNAISFTQAMTLDASGNLGVGRTSPANVFNSSGGVDANGMLVFRGALSQHQTDAGVLQYNANAVSLRAYGSTAGSGYITFNTGGGGNSADTERARITSSGYLLVNATSGSQHVIKKPTAGSLSGILNIQDSSVDVAVFAGGETTAPSITTNSVLYVGRSSTSLRSINATGTINQNGADYAEYMTKCGDFVVAKGDVVGINADGKLTNVYQDAVSFCVKSTDPGLVGGDSWFMEPRPKNEDGTELPSDAVEFVEWYDRLEKAREKVDRVAFCGQVPVNVTGATPGQYIVPVNDNGAIKGEAVSNPTFEQYQMAVGKVIAIQEDGRAFIIVKVA